MAINPHQHGMAPDSAFARLMRDSAGQPPKPPAPEPEPANRILYHILKGRRGRLRLVKR